LKNLIFFLSSFIFIGSLLSQSNEFEGSIMYSDKKNLLSSLDIFIDSSYQVTGSLTRMIGAKKMNHTIEGKFNHEDNSICPIYINGYVKHLMENFYVIAGVFQSSNTTFCDSGHVNLVNRNFKFNLYNRVEKSSQLDDSAVMQNLMSGLKSKMDADKIFIPVTSQDKISLSIDKDTFILKIYDNLRIDGDKVKIIFNDAVVVNNLSIVAKPFEYILKAKKGKNILTIKAISEGSIPMNTSKVELYNYRLHEYFENKLLKDQQSTYIINYE
jgi:hypothetical protein